MLKVQRTKLKSTTSYMNKCTREIGFQDTTRNQLTLCLLTSEMKCLMEFILTKRISALLIQTVYSSKLMTSLAKSATTSTTVAKKYSEAITGLSS